MPRSSTISVPTRSTRWSSSWRSRRNSGLKSRTRTPKRLRASRKPSTTSRRTRRPRNRGGDFEQARRRYRHRIGGGARDRNQGDLGGAARGTERCHPYHALRRFRLRDADRGGGEGIRPARVHREEGKKKNGPFHQ